MKKKETTVACRCEPEFKKRVMEAAKASDMGISEWVRTVLELELNNGSQIERTVVYSRVRTNPVLRVAEGPPA